VATVAATRLGALRLSHCFAVTAAQRQASVRPSCAVTQSCCKSTRDVPSPSPQFPTVGDGRCVTCHLYRETQASRPSILVLVLPTPCHCHTRLGDGHVWPPSRDGKDLLPELSTVGCWGPVLFEVLGTEAKARPAPRGGL
jgi:hypothetical protein